MTTLTNSASAPTTAPSLNIKMAPQDAHVREAIRSRARRAATTLDRQQPLERPRLEALARGVLSALGLTEGYLGFTMVALSTAFWREQYAATPFHRRLLLLPHCPRNTALCKGGYDELGLECAECGACPLGGLKREAESLGYKVLIAEGTPAVVQVALSGRADALLGVACLESLEKAFARLVQLGIPHAAAPLLKDGCVDTVMEVDEVRRLMLLSAQPAAVRTRSYLPLLRAAEALFKPGAFESLLDGSARPAVGPQDAGPVDATQAIALDWVRRGGKRFRPFITLASYAASVHGERAFDPASDVADALPWSVRRVALALEALHKASLVHDDVEDDDAFRYGRETLHRRYGPAVAVNIGDYLIGLGYRLVASAQADIGASCAADIIAQLSNAHLKLCRGQGAELLLGRQPPGSAQAIDILTAYALKTAPAFEVALAAGLRMASDAGAYAPDVSPKLLKQFARSIGVAYQIENDLHDWDEDNTNKLIAGQDALAARPTILQAFALEAGDAASNRELLALVQAERLTESTVRQLRDAFEARGAFERGQRLVAKYRNRANALAEGVDSPAMRDLMKFIVDVLL